jgi:hypothetical protein
LAGDSAREEFETLRREFGVDLTNFNLAKYFPSELSNDTFIATLFGWIKFGQRVRQKYPPITLSMIEEVLSCKTWKFD